MTPGRGEQSPLRFPHASPGSGEIFRRPPDARSAACEPCPFSGVTAFQGGFFCFQPRRVFRLTARAGDPKPDDACGETNALRDMRPFRPDGRPRAAPVTPQGRGRFPSRVMREALRGAASKAKRRLLRTVGSKRAVPPPLPGLQGLRSRPLCVAFPPRAKQGCAKKAQREDNRNAPAPLRADGRIAAAAGPKIFCRQRLPFPQPPEHVTVEMLRATGATHFRACRPAASGA